MIEMTNKNLSELFGVNFAKWKRWNREFIECYEGSETERGYLKNIHLKKRSPLCLVAI